MRSAQSVAAPSGPTDPDRVTLCPATTGLGLAWTTTATPVTAAEAGGGRDGEQPGGGGRHEQGDETDRSHDDLPR